MKKGREEIFQQLTLGGFLVYIIAMPISNALVNIGAIAALAGMLGMVIVQGRKSVLWRFPLYLPLLLFIGYLIINCWCVSVFPQESWRSLRAAWYRVFPMILVGMVAASLGKKALFVILGSFLFAGFYEGLDGIYQFITGADFIHGTKGAANRLTGSFSSYRVGSLIAFYLSPTLVLPFILPASWPAAKRWGLSILLWSPLVFLLVFSKTRTGFICVGVSLFALFCMLEGLSWKKISLLILVFLLLSLLWPQRFGYEVVLRDGRLRELWPFAWNVFKAHPLFGCGLYAFNPVFHAMGMTPVMHSKDIMHPHNIYMQLLAETGIVGLILFLFFTLGAVIWCARRIRLGLATSEDRPFWLACAAFWSVMIGYLGMGMSGHDLLRSWWFGMAMSIFGITIGSVLKK